MNGPGYGYNIEKWLCFFNDNYDKYSLTFLSETEYQFKIFKNIKVIKFRNNLFKFLYSLYAKIGSKYDIFFLHGAYNILISIYYIYMFRYKVIIFCPWGYRVINKAINGKYRYGYRMIISKSSLILGNHHMNELIMNKYPIYKTKIKDFYWGMDNKWFDDDKEKITKYTSNLLDSVNINDIFIFYPRSILRLHRYDLLIEAFNEIKKQKPEIIKNVIIMIWCGVIIDDKYKVELEELIREYKLNKYFVIKIHPYVNITDLKAIWKRCNFSVNIIDNDGFSNQISEAFYMKKPIIMSKIPAYTIIDNLYGLKLDYVENNVESIKNQLIKFIQNYKNYDDKILEKRKYFVMNNMNFYNNISTLLELIKNKLF